MKRTRSILPPRVHCGVLVVVGAALIAGAGSPGIAAPSTRSSANPASASPTAANPTSEPVGQPGPTTAASGGASSVSPFSLQEQTNRESLAAQKKVEALDDETQQLLAKYRGIVTETASYDAYARQLESSIASQDEELARIADQMARANDTARDVLPLTARLVDDLDQFVTLDLPFQLEERKQRIAGLRSLMTRADVSLSEKYRRVIEAYLIELEYGRTMETYEGVLDTGDQPLTVDFLRIGRIALLYQTPDGAHTGYWDADAKRWVEREDYARAFKKGVRIASKQDAPDLVVAPVHAAAEM